MKMLRTLSLAAALALASTAAVGFQEQKAGGPAAPAAAVTDKALGVSEQAAAKPASGTEVRIPGLGKLGVLPKMDFGLELLYGAAEKPAEPTTREITPSDDDLTIRGTVKHRF